MHLLFFIFFNILPLLQCSIGSSSHHLSLIYRLTKYNPNPSDVDGVCWLVRLCMLHVKFRIEL